MKTFSIGKVSVYLIIPFLVPVFYSIREVGFSHIYGLNFTQHPLLVSVIMFLSELVCGIKPLYKYCTNRNQKKEEITMLYNNEVLTGKEKENEEKELQSQNVLILYLQIALSALIDFLGYTCTSLLCAYPDIQQNNVQIEMRILPLFVMSFLSWKYLNFSFYKHHIMATLLIGIGYIFIMIVTFNKVNEPLNPYLIFLIFAIINIVYAIKQINDKIIIDKKYISTSCLLCMQGVFGLFFCIISFAIAIFVPCNPNWKFCTGQHFENFINMWPNILGDLNLSIGIYLIILFLSSIGLNVFLMMTKKYFTPTHRNVSDTMNAFVAWVINMFSNKETSMINIIGYASIMLGCLIYNEIIICRFCGLDEDTKEEIMNRAGVSMNNIKLVPDKEEKIKIIEDKQELY